MKNNLLTGILAIAVFVLYILHFSGDSSNQGTSVNIPSSDSTKTEEPIVINIDSLGIDTLKEAAYAKIGYINMFLLVDTVPEFEKALRKISSAKEDLKRKEYAIQKGLMDWKTSKESEMNQAAQMNLLTPQAAQEAEREFMVKQQEAGQKMQQLQGELESVLMMEQNEAVKRNEKIKKALDSLNEYFKFDYVLVEDGMNANVFPLNDKNDITLDIAKLINTKKF